MTRHRARLPPPPTGPAVVQEIAGPAASGLTASFTARNVQPPGQLYITLDDLLFITSANAIAGVVVQIRVRMLLPGKAGIKVLAFTHTPNSDRTAKTDTFTLAEGFLLSISAFATGSTTFRGATYATLGLAYGSPPGNIVSAVLIQDYLTNTVTCSWPGNIIRAPGEGPGWIHEALGTAPPLGGIVLETVPQNTVWRVISIRVTLTHGTDNSSVFARFFLENGADVFYKVECPVGQANNTTIHYTLFATGQVPTIVISDETLPFPAGVALAAGWSFSVDTTFQPSPNDQWTAPAIAREEWVVI